MLYQILLFTVACPIGFMHGHNSTRGRRTTRFAADSTGNRLPEETALSKWLVEAARDGNVAKAETLLASGACPDSGLSAGYSALGLAINRGHTDLARLLLEKGANGEAAVSGGASALLVAVVWNRCDILQLLLAHGCRLDETAMGGSHRGQTALEVALERGRSECAEAIIRERAARRLSRLRRLVPIVNAFAVALCELYAQVHYRPDGTGARRAQEHFYALAAPARRSDEVAACEEAAASSARRPSTTSPPLPPRPAPPCPSPPPSTGAPAFTEAIDEWTRALPPELIGAAVSIPVSRDEEP